MLLEPPLSPADYPSASQGANLVGRPLLFGATSITGYAITRQCEGRIVAVASHSAVARRSRWHTADAEDADSLAALLEHERPEVVIWAHAVCDVAKCEAHPQWASAINVRGVENLLRHLPASSRLVYLSSDHVFGGDGTYTELCEPAPISVYGRTRVAAERLILERPRSLVVRPGLAIGPSADGRGGFLDWLTYRHARGLPVTVISDEYRSVMWADDLAARLLSLAASDIVGLRHIPAARAVSRPELARHLLRLRGIIPRFVERTRFEQPAPHLGRVEIHSIHTDDYATPLSPVL